ncbi:hypothetical protein F5Y17DRAFT_128097 [Xylariaceae sp. FL0594]|nr:hypothetical protein F5Y17DRAFT_128097 [Xylariaceae sp. FL0594]
MAGKIRLPLVEKSSANAMNRNRRRNKHIFVVLLVALTTYSLYVCGLFSNYANALLPPQSKAVPNAELHDVSDAVKPSPSAQTRKELVPLEAHIISKCPDTRDCLRELLLPAMIQVHDKVNFTLSYIGVTTENDGVDCKHGPGECMGNIIELCAHQLYPDPKIWLGFTMCLTKDYHLIPQRELVEDCALEHAVDFAKLNECATRDDGAFGMSMLRESVKRSASVSKQAARSA